MYLEFQFVDDIGDDLRNNLYRNFSSFSYSITIKPNSYASFDEQNMITIESEKLQNFEKNSSEYFTYQEKFMDYAVKLIKKSIDETHNMNSYIKLKNKIWKHL